MSDCKILKYLPVGLTLKKLNTDADFTYISLRQMIYQYTREYEESPHWLLLGTDEIPWIDEIPQQVKELGLACKFFADVNDDSWAIMGAKGAIYSPGA